MLHPTTYHTEDGEYIFSVSELNLSAKEALEDHFQSVLVTGEVSNFSRPASGHIYFSLKDENACIRCAWFRGRQSPLGFSLENGIHVILLAEATIYPDKGEYQLLVRKIHLAGAGLIKQKLEALKRKLAAEGLFAPEHKKPLPVFPKTVGVITSKTGAALQDILAVLKRRAPFITVRVYACQVQGRGATDTIIRALNHAMVDRESDVLLLTRGGGSNEDLWAFNSEQLAYTIFNCPIPVVSAVGHEIDLSIADFVADMRAPTPSAAAELISPHQEDLYACLNDRKMRLLQGFKKVHHEKMKHVTFFSRLLVHPVQKLHEQQRLLQQRNFELNKIIHRILKQQKVKIDFLTALTHKNNPQQQITILNKQLAGLSDSLNQYSKNTLLEKKMQFSLLIEKLETFSPISTLRRGYAILYTEKNEVLENVNGVKPDDKITAQLTNGKLLCKVEKIIY